MMALFSAIYIFSFSKKIRSEIQPFSGEKDHDDDYSLFIQVYFLQGTESAYNTSSSLQSSEESSRETVTKNATKRTVKTV